MELLVYVICIATPHLTNNDMPVGIETYGVYGPKGLKLIKQIGKKIQEATGEKLFTFYLMQSILMAIQRGNAACVRGCP